MRISGNEPSSVILKEGNYLDFVTYYIIYLLFKVFLYCCIIN